MQVLKGRGWDLVWLSAGLLAGGVFALGLLGFEYAPLWLLVVLVVLVLRPSNRLAWQIVIVFWLVSLSPVLLNLLGGNERLDLQMLQTLSQFHLRQPWWFVPMAAMLLALLAGWQAKGMKVGLVHDDMPFFARGMQGFAGHWGYWLQWVVLFVSGTVLIGTGANSNLDGIMAVFGLAGSWDWVLVAGILLLYLWFFFKLLAHRIGLGSLLFGLGVPYAVTLLVILVLKYLDGELPGGNAATKTISERFSPQWKILAWRVGIILLLLLAAVAGETFWWLKTTTYSVTETDAEGKEKEVLYTLPTEYALQRVLWQLGIVMTPVMQEISVGEFQMGGVISKEVDEELRVSRRVDEGLHPIKFKQPFNMSRYEITFAEYDHYVWLMRENGMGDVQYPHDEGWGRGTRPVINVSWDDAQGYVNWLSKETGSSCRLPTEAEWEYAARAGTTTDYFWGDTASHDYANYGKDECCDGLAVGKDQWVNTAPVGSFPANPFGLHDMQGNIFEWVQDCWHDDYQGAPADGEVWESGGDCGRRVLRGGAWGGDPDFLRASNRNGLSPDYRDDDVGFRVVCVLPSAGR